MQDYVGLAVVADFPFFFLLASKSWSSALPLGWDHLARGIDVPVSHVGHPNFKVKQPSQHSPLRIVSLALQQGSYVDPAGKIPSRQAATSHSAWEYASRFHIIYKIASEYWCYISQPFWVCCVVMTAEE